MAEVGRKRTRSGTDLLNRSAILVHVTVPQGKRECTASRNATVASSGKDEVTTKEIRKLMQELDLEMVERHFAVLEGTSDDNCAGGNVGIEPFVVCTGVSVDAFNRYVDEEEKLPIALRFLEFDIDGRLLIVEYPSEVHETVVSEFGLLFNRAFGDTAYLGNRGAMTVSRTGLPRKEGDAAFGPLRNAPNAARPTLRRQGTIHRVTFVLEVGIAQPWSSLEAAARFWYGYPGIQYVLLLKVSKKAIAITYRLYDVINNPIVQQGTLPAPAQSGSLRYKQNGAPENITLDNSRILDIQAGQALPPGVNAFSVIDLRTLMNKTISTID